jgi:hypothetical protein
MTTEQTNVNITLQDLATIVNIIDVCSQRGAFKGEELSVVGQVREKVAAIVKANTPAETAQEETEEETGA